jgi:L-lactate dehydrogenase (cytochrome)
MIPAAPYDYRALARRRLPKFLFEYLDGGAYAEVTMRRNRADLEQIELRQRVMRDVASIDLSAVMFGREYSMPAALAPIGIAGMNARRGEVQAVGAANRRNVPFCLSTVGACPIDEVARSATAPFWFQLYMIRDRGFMRDLLQKAKAAGCPVLVFTVDMPVPASRYRDYRSGLAGAAGSRGTLRRLGQAMLKPRWAWDVGIRGRPHGLGNVAPVLGDRSGLKDFFAWMKGNFDPSIDWRDLDFVREQWQGPLVIKGIMDVEDARAARDHGADGIVVSNHGGRQLDGVPSTARALPAIAEEVGDALTILADGGVTSGLDVVRMLALGANAVLLGRAWVYALAGRGQAGVEHLLQLIADEMRVAMALTGVTRVDAIDARNLAASMEH